MNGEMNSGQNPQKSDGQEFVFDKYIAIALAVGLLAGFLIGNSVGANRNEAGNASSTENSLVFGGDATSTSPAVNVGTIAAMSANDMVTVGSQKAGNTVVVSKLVLDGTYWVAVRDNIEGVKVPYVLGARKLQAGTYNDLSVYVSRPTIAGTKYDVVLYKDSPNFNYGVDALLMKDGKVVRTTFEATR